MSASYHRSMQLHESFNSGSSSVSAHAPNTMHQHLLPKQISMPCCMHTCGTAGGMGAGSGQIQEACAPGGGRHRSLNLLHGILLGLQLQPREAVVALQHAGNVLHKLDCLSCLLR